jgi:PKD repeat protein
MSPVGDNTSSLVAVYVVASPIPFVDFIGTPVASASAPLTVQYTDLSTALGGITGWNWSFGDGTYSNNQNPLHTYIISDQYSVTLVASSGAYQNYTSKIGYINVGVAPNTVSANFVASPTYSSTTPVSVQFTDTSVCNPVCTHWAWDFNGDGLTDSTLENPVYTYTYPGNYSPKLIVSSDLISGTRIRNLYISVGPIYVPTTIPQPTATWNPSYNGTSATYSSNTNIDLANSTYLKYWLQNFSSTGNFSVYGFTFGIMAPIMHVFGFWIYLIIWGLYLFAVWVRSQDVTMPLIIGILSIGTFGLLFPKESFPVILTMFAVCGTIIITKLMKDSV